MLKGQSRVVYTVELQLHAHVFYRDSGTWLHLRIPDRHDKRMDSFVFTLHYGLRKDDSVVRMTCTIGYPELLRK